MLINMCTDVLILINSQNTTHNNKLLNFNKDYELF